MEFLLGQVDRGGAWSLYLSLGSGNDSLFSVDSTHHESSCSVGLGDEKEDAMRASNGSIINQCGRRTYIV